MWASGAWNPTLAFPSLGKWPLPTSPFPSLCSGSSDVQDVRRHRGDVPRETRQTVNRVVIRTVTAVAVGLLPLGRGYPLRPLCVKSTIHFPLERQQFPHFSAQKDIPLSSFQTKLSEIQIRPRGWARKERRRQEKRQKGRPFSSSCWEMTLRNEFYCSSLKNKFQITITNANRNFIIIEKCLSQWK